MKPRLRKNILRDTGGNVLILAGLGILFLVGIGGAGYDLGRQQLVRQKIQQASDAAALAAAGMDFGTPSGTRQNTAQAFFTLNYPQNYLGIPRPTPSVSIAGERVTVSASAPVPTSFVGNFGVSTIAAAGSSTTQFKRVQTVLDVILVMDNSGSMGARQNLFFPGSLGSYDVGTGNSTNASGGVRPICRAGWLAYVGQYNAAYGTNFGSFTNAQANTNCNDFEGANGFNRINALRFSAASLADTLMNPNPNNNRMALATWDAVPIGSQNFTGDANAVRSFLSVMYGRGQTNSTMGLQQAQTLSSGFRTGTAHAVILMTDGVNQGPNGFNDQVPFNNASLALCNAFKARGTVVYTIGFGSELVGTNPIIVRANDFLSDCATGPNGPGSPNLNTFYFRAPDAAALSRAFTAIAGSLSKVQILQ